MKNDKSVIFTHAVIRICYFLLAAAAVVLPITLRSGFYEFDVLGEIKNYVLVPFYAVVPAGYLALICLDKLLINIRRDIVFDKKNVSLLRCISYACVYAGTVGIIAFAVILLKKFVFDTMLVLSCGEFFMALVVRVVKNVFEKAIEIKEENDLTI